MKINESKISFGAEQKPTNESQTNVTSTSNREQLMFDRPNII